MGEHYILGMDGGGTATKAALAKIDGAVFARLQAGPLNINGQTEEAAAGAILEMIQAIEEPGRSLKDCQGVCIGAAGVSNSISQTVFQTVFKENGFQGKMIVTGDHETALAAALPEPYGVILIAGTGSICFGVDKDGSKYRAGGYGHIIDDAGSAYAIGRDILQAVVRGEDGRGCRTRLKELVYSQLQIASIDELINWLYHPGRSKKEIAALAVSLERGTAEKDPAAERISERAALELSALAKAVLAKMKDEPMVVVSGSVLMKNKYILESFRLHLNKEYEGVKVLKMQGRPEEGAVKIIRAELYGDPALERIRN